MRFGGLFVCGMLAFLAIAVNAFTEGKCDDVYGNGPDIFVVATGSPGELGVLKALGDAFGQEHNATLCWVKAGSGDSLTMLKEKKVDMIMVHAPKVENKAAEDGWATKRMLIGSNEFYMVGPPYDPAEISEAKSAIEAYRRIAAAKAKFISRGDNSGTHKKELEIWNKA